MEQKDKKIISVLVEDEFGALSRITRIIRFQRLQPTLYL